MSENLPNNSINKDDHATLRSLTANSGFDYVRMEEFLKEEQVANKYQSLREAYAKQTKAWSEQLNSEWLIRNYLAIKMILSSSVLLSSLEYAIEKNLKVVEPYLLYYALLNTCRAVIFTSPSELWGNGKLISLSHSKIINITSSIVSGFDKNTGTQLECLLLKSKCYRELFSYRFPANGIKSLPKDTVVDINDVILFCSFLCEVAQFNSALLQESVGENTKGEYDSVDAVIEKGFQYDLSEGDMILDDEDYYRIGYILRKVKKPFNLFWTMSEGMVEDFFGAWCPNEENSKEAYDPDKNWRIIFPVP